MNKVALIREKIVDLLKSRIPGFEDRVFDSLECAIWETELPALNVLSGDESAERYGQGYERTYLRTLDIAVELAISSSENTQNELDRVCGLIEEALNDDPVLGGVCENIDYVSMASVIASNGGKKFGTAELKFEVVYVS